MYKYSKFLFLNSVIFSSLIAISSYSWFSMWVGLEINLLSIIPLFNSMKNYYPSEAALKYFITQSMASTIVLFSILNFINLSEIYTPSFISQMMFDTAILIKMGAAPFHFWFPEIMEGLNWVNSLILLTWQKVAPLLVISYTIKFSSFFFTVIVSCALIGGIMGLNQVSLRKIMTFSSINHLGWMLSSMIISNLIWLNYFIIYALISVILIFKFKKINSFYLMQFFNFNFKNKKINLMFSMMFFSLGGLPPLMGFFPKWMTVSNLALNNLFHLPLILIILTLLTLFYYLRITFNSMMFSYKESIIYKLESTKMWILSLNAFNLVSLIGAPLMLNWF